MYEKVINVSNKVVTLLVYSIYPITLLILIYLGDPRIWRVILAPLISFVLVSIFRNAFNAPRPYEVNNTTPILNKKTKGKSFPSRHVFSVFVIASTLYYISMPLGIFLMFAGCVLAVTRVIGGVHFTRDVVAGALIGMLSGFLGFYL